MFCIPCSAVDRNRTGFSFVDRTVLFRPTSLTPVPLIELKYTSDQETHGGAIRESRTGSSTILDLSAKFTREGLSSRIGGPCEFVRMKRSNHDLKPSRNCNENCKRCTKRNIDTVLPEADLVITPVTPRSRNTRAANCESSQSLPEIVKDSTPEPSLEDYLAFRPIRQTLLVA